MQRVKLFIFPSSWHIIIVSPCKAPKILLNPIPHSVPLPFKDNVFKIHFFLFKCVLTKCILWFYVYIFSIYVNEWCNLSHYISCFLTKYYFSDNPCLYMNTESIASNQHSFSVVYMHHLPSTPGCFSFLALHIKLQWIFSHMSLQGPAWRFLRCPFW